MSKSGLVFHDVTLGYDSHAAVHHLSGKVEAGSLTAVVGMNGSGKSTLMKGIAGLVKPMSGRIDRHAASVAYLPQKSELDQSFPARVIDLVSMGLWPRRGLLGRTTVGERARVREAIEAVGLAGFERRTIDSLSGGQLQRGLFARAIVQDAEMILLDEPFNAIDSRTVADLVALVRRWHAEGRTVMAAVHDLDLVLSVFPQTLLLARRLVALGPTGDVLTPANLRRASRFDEAWHDDASWCEGGGQGGPPHDHNHDRPAGGTADHRPAHADAAA